jgi:NADPH:quinone reductase-like Zn-dependent oxidoreductase
MGDFPEPLAGPGQIRIAVHAAGVSPVDLAIRAGTSPSAQQFALPHIPGVDAEAGAAVSSIETATRGELGGIDRPSPSR